MKITEQELKTLIREALVANLKEAPELSDDWVQYMKEVDDWLQDTIDGAKKLVAKGEDLKAEKREKSTVANPVNSARENHYQYIDERVGFLKGLVSRLAQRYETWKSNY